MTHKTIALAALLFLAFSLCQTPARAIDLTQGLMRAVPIPHGKPPIIDGDLSDWDLSGAEPVWISDQTAPALHAVFALMYDNDYLYIGAEVSLPGRPLHNSANPVDAFWQGDLLQFRVAADPELPSPLNNTVTNNRVAHISLWKNTDTGRDYMDLNYGVKFDKGIVVNPSGSLVVIKTHGETGYTIEARVPWAALNVPGGHNPFTPGQKMSAVLDLIWLGGDQSRTAALYRTNPGEFAFMQPQTWGQVEFSAVGSLPARHDTMAQVLARLASAPSAPAVGVPFIVPVPAEGLKVSVNIVGPHGEVIREIMGGESHPKGPLTVYWDGKDQWGNAMTPGTYKWGAYFSRGLQAVYQGGVGKSADPYYDTLDGKGGWGADHSNPISVAADASGLYFLWPVAESGRAIVKTGYNGRVIWRKTPFVGGGFGPFYAVASNGKNIFLTLGDAKPQLVRLDAITGRTLTWGDAPDALAETPISDSTVMEVPPISSPIGSQPESIGLAASATEVFASVYSQNRIQVLDTQTGKPTRTLACPGPRGLCLDGQGNLYAVSYVPGESPQIVRFAAAQGEAHPVITHGLIAPWGVAVDAQGDLHITDGGASQQVKNFAPDGRFLSAWGKPGGRSYIGTYDPAGFLNPAGIAADAQGGILLAEASIPKVMSRWDAASGKPLAHWFGGPSYWDGTWPDPDNPRSIYYQLPGGFARADLSRPDWPEAYWDMPDAGRPDLGDSGVIPTTLMAKNGRKYLVNDVSPNAIYLVQGDTMRPIAYFHVHNRGEQDTPQGKDYVEVWQDANGDGRVQPSELTVFDTVQGKPLAPLGDWMVSTTTMTPNGDLYIESAANKILKIPAAGFRSNGTIQWDLARAYYVVPTVMPAFGDSMYVGPRGQAGLRVDSRGDIYTCFAATAPSLSAELAAKMRAAFPTWPQYEWGAYATQALADKMHEGLGHTAESNAVKFAKFDKNGRMLWIAGRKATAAARPGEMYHFWSLAGLVNDDYIVGASEWGPMYVYTSDGFFVDSLFNNPGLNPPPGPYTFGSETGTGRIQYFPKQDQVWAYAVGMAYLVKGFSHGKVDGERRASGTVALDKIYDTANVVSPQAAPLEIAAMHGDPMTDANAWADVPTSTLQRNGSSLATAQLGYDAGYLYGRIHVTDDSPLQNSADRVNTAFKGGDTAGILLGSGMPHTPPRLGDIRIMAAEINGQPHLIAMKPVTDTEKRPEDYFTPAGGHARFDFVGDVPGGKVVLNKDADGLGYTAIFAVPRAFLDISLSPGTPLSGDIEVRLSGDGARGLQATSRNYLFTPLRSETTMTDDMPTEARLYPQYWGMVQVK